MAKGAPTPASFKPGDPDGRAAAAGRIGGAVQAKHRKVENSFLDQLKERGPMALEALDRMLAKDDPTAVRVVVDRMAPKDLVENAEVARALDQLKVVNDELRADLEELLAEMATEVALREAAEGRADRLEHAAKKSRDHLMTGEAGSHGVCGRA